ncbi:MAG: DUF4255 domain-containing protein [bacterium]
MTETAIHDVGLTLVSLLDNELKNIIGADRISLESPAEVDTGDTRLSLYLYSIIENPDLKNTQKIVIDPKTQNYPSLVLDLYYLLTSYAPDNLSPREQTQESQRNLGRAMRLLYDNGIIGGTKLQGSLKDKPLELHVTLNPITVEDLTRIWSVFPEQFYRTSVSYVVTPVPIESQRNLESQRVVRKDADHDQMAPRREEV